MSPRNDRHAVDTVRFGRQIRALRRRRRWRQQDLADRSGLSRGQVARIELGEADRATVRTLEGIAGPLQARFIGRLDWNGEALDRLLDAGHAAIVEVTVATLLDAGWRCETEVSFNIAGERGSIDVLAWHPTSHALVVIEVKSTVPDVQATLFVLDRKVRLAREIGARRGWPAGTLSKLLVVRDDRTTRRRVDRHAAIFGNAFPARTREVNRWIRSPAAHVEAIAGLQFLSGVNHPDTSLRRPRRQGLGTHDSRPPS